MAHMRLSHRLLAGALWPPEYCVDDFAGPVNGANVKYQLNAGGTFGAAKTMTTLTKGLATTLGDSDGDGDLDVYVLQTADSTGNLPDYLLVNSGLTFPKGTGSGGRRQRGHGGLIGL